MRNSRLIVGVLTIMLPLSALGDDRDKELINAARRGNVEQVKTLLEQGADANATTEYGATALFFAADRGNMEIIQLLLDHGADVNAKDTFYEATALTWAAMSDHADAVKLLLEKGAEGAEDVLGMAAALGKVEIATVVIDSGKVKPEDLSDAYAAALARGHTDVAELIKNSGITIETKPAVEVAPEVLARYAGTYKNADLGMTFNVKPGEGKLKAAVVGQSELTYSPTDQTTFQSVEVPGIKLVFKVEEGKVPSFTVEQGGQSFVFVRASEAEAAEDTAPESAPERVAETGEGAGADSNTTPTTEPAGSDVTDRPARVLQPQNWPSFRGLRASGVADGQSAPTTWDATTMENIRWKTPIPGLGHASPIIWGNRIFIATAISGEPEPEFRHGLYGDVDSADDDTVHTWKVFGLDKHSGKILWEQTACQGVPKVKRHMKASHANCTPATDGRHLVVSFASEGLYCYSLDGTLLWKRDLGILDSGWFYNPDYQWGFSSSPIIYGNLAIVQCDIQEDSFIAAFDLTSGSEVWRTPRQEIPSWGTPTLYQHAGRAQVVTNSSKHVCGYDPLTGQELWRLSGNSEVTVGTPVTGHGLMFFTGGYPPIQPVYAVKASATGDITLPEGADSSEHVAWATRRGGTYMPTPIVYGDYLYTCANHGILTCYDARSGERLYRRRIADGKGGGYTASPIAADGRLYFTSEDGDIFVVRAGPQYELLGTNPMGEVCMATPAISDGLLVVRTVKHLFGIGPGGAKPSPAGG
jgi:outer membrane protein assembly factor BamB